MSNVANFKPFCVCVYVWSCTLFGLLPVSSLQARENIILAELHVAEGDPTSVKFPLTHTTNQKTTLGCNI